MEYLTANLVSGKVRSARLGGRDYVVVPMTMIVPGVLPGSAGSLYYPPEEVGRNVGAWNHVPITLHHPVINGLSVSARDPDVLDGRGLGFVFRAVYNDRLTAEAWFDVVRTDAVDSQLLPNIRAGKPLEISTGLYLDQQPAPAGSSYKGKSYDSIATNYRPDHLAVLPGQTGACSVKDGCGININSTEQPTTIHGGHSVDREATINFLVANCDCWKEQGDREVLNGLSDTKLKALKDGVDKTQKDVVVANAAKQGFKHDGKTYAYDVAKAKFVVHQADDANHEPPNAEPDKDKKDVKDPPAAPPPGNNQAKPPMQPMTMNEWLQTAPLEVQSAFRTAASIEQRERDALVQRLTANVADATKEAMQTHLKTKPIEELRLLFNLLPPVSAQTDATPVYLGQSTPHVNVALTDKERDDVLPLPTINWREESENRRKAAR